MVQYGGWLAVQEDFNMRKLIIILLFLSSLISEGQMMANGEKFIYSALTDMSPASYSSAGTVVIRRKRIENMDIGTLSGYGIEVTGTTNILLINCVIGPTISNGITGTSHSGTIEAYQCLFVLNRVGVEYSASTGNLKIRKCWFLNPWGAPQCKGQAVQFESVTTADSYIEDSKGESIYAEGNPEDWISMYTATGTTNPIRIRRNNFRGGGPSVSGGGIMSGDTDGGNQLVEYNKLFNVANYHFAIASGIGCTVRFNMSYQVNDGVSTILMYCYGGQNGAVTCSGHAINDNRSNFWNGSNLFYGGDGSGPEDCGDIIGIASDYVANPNSAWLETNDNSLTLAEMNFPAVLIDCVSEDILWRLRDRSTEFSDEGGCKNTDQRSRPTAGASGGGAIFTSSTALTATGGGTYRWVQVKGPNTATHSAPTSASNTVSGLIDGVYIFRVEVYDGAGASDANWITVTVTLT